MRAAPADLPIPPAANAAAVEAHRRVVARIRALSDQRGIVLAHLPDRAAVASSHFWDVLAFRKSPSLDWLTKVAEALEVDVEELFRRKA